MSNLWFSTEADPEIRILVQGSAEAGYMTSIRGSEQRKNSNSLFEAVSTALQSVGRLIDQRTFIKVAAGTHLTTKNLIEIMRACVWPDQHFWGPTGWLDLSGCRLWAADLGPNRLDEMNVPANLRRAQTGGINLDRVRLRACEMWQAQLQEASLVQTDMRECNLGGADLTGALVLQTQFAGANLAQADLRGLDLRTVASLDRTAWSGAKLEKTWFFRRQIEPTGDELAAIDATSSGSYVSAAEAFLVLRSNFNSLGSYDDASWAHLKEQQMEKAASFPTSLGRQWIANERSRQTPPRHWWSLTPEAIRFRLETCWLHILLFLRPAKLPADRWAAFGPDVDAYRWSKDHRRIHRLHWLRCWAYELLTGYGERPLLPVAWGALTILTFFFAYWAAGNVATGDLSAGASPSHDPLAALTHSISAFATIGFNTLEPIGWGARLMTAIESMLGIGFFALFIYTLGNRMSRS